MPTPNTRSRRLRASVSSTASSAGAAAAVAGHWQDQAQHGQASDLDDGLHAWSSRDPVHRPEPE
jgi:hypothetical protein